MKTANLEYIIGLVEKNANFEPDNYLKAAKSLKRTYTTSLNEIKKEIGDRVPDTDTEDYTTELVRRIAMMKQLIAEYKNISLEDRECIVILEAENMKVIHEGYRNIDKGVKLLISLITRCAMNGNKVKNASYRVRGRGVRYLIKDGKIYC